MIGIGHHQPILDSEEGSSHETDKPSPSSATLICQQFHHVPFSEI